MDIKVGLYFLVIGLCNIVQCYKVEPTRSWVPDNPNWGSKRSFELWYTQVKKPFKHCPEYKFPINTNVNCVESSEGGECEVACIGKNHFFGERSNVQQMILSCRSGRWGIKNGAPTAKTIQHCEGACACQNGGICNGENYCHCPKGYAGVHCEKHQTYACPEEPPHLPKNSITVCRGDSCEVECERGFAFSDGRSRVLLKCVGTSYKDMMSTTPNVYPDCLATCVPACLNGGKCIAVNVCECPPNYRGLQCQDAIARCELKPTFNGNFQCKHGPFSTECQLSCPSTTGVSVLGQLHPLYLCRYDTGTFEPSPTAKCLYPTNLNVSQQITTSYTHTNGTVTVTGDETWPNNLITTCGRYGRYNSRKDWKPVEPNDGDVCGLRLRRKPAVGTIIKAQPSICSSWGGRHIRTFDGLIFEPPLTCDHILVSDKLFGAYHVAIRKSCALSGGPTNGLVIQVLFESVLYTIENINGSLVVGTPLKRLPLPVQVVGMKIVPVAQNIEIEFETVGLKIIWDQQQRIDVHASESLWGKLVGLCGYQDVNPDNHLWTSTRTVAKSCQDFADSWKLPGKSCTDQPVSVLDTCQDKEQHTKAVERCKQLLLNLPLKPCLEQFNQETLLQVCLKDYCGAKDDSQKTRGTCDFLMTLVEGCKFNGKEPVKDWRNLSVCPISCSGDQIYQNCGPQSPATCESEEISVKGKCFDGCFCPRRKLLYKDQCIDRKMCPCQLRGREFQPGEKYQKECNTCTCLAGKWQCTDKKCGKRCTAFGDPHYRTFDGRQYDFQGRCFYYLLMTSSLTIEGENVRCLADRENIKGSSCTRTLIIRFNLRDGSPIIIKLAQKLQTFVNGQVVTQLPVHLGNGEVILRRASSRLLTVTFEDGLVVSWNGESTVHIDAPFSYRDTTGGLCGTFNDNTKDDFLTPDGDFEHTAVAFANKWRTKEMCGDITVPDKSNSCLNDPEKRKSAEKLCSWFKADIFKPCHWAIDPESNYDNCLTDICALTDKNDVHKTLCELIAVYANECARNGYQTGWRREIKECMDKCPEGQEYDECGDSCALSCADLQERDKCKRECADGCRCPNGQYLNEKQECVPQKSCSCFYDGFYFKPGYKEVRAGQRVQQLCTCVKGLWDCHDADDQDLTKFPPQGGLRKQCAKRPFAKFISCAPNEPKTCKNMHNFSPDTSSCRPGCVCTDGYVYDVTKDECVPPEKCSCHHAGRSFNDGDTFNEACNVCVCQGGLWKCTRNDCESTCSVWGDSHFSTFDGRDYDFLGACDYILSKGKNDQGSGFLITLQNVICGSNGITCSKSLEITLSGKNGEEKLKLGAGGKQQLGSRPSSSFHIYKAGLFVVVEVIHLHLQIKWDEGTRVYVRLGNEWRGRVAGLCGNNNGNSVDDFKSPSGGQETEPTLFGHSWRINQQCELPVQPFDTCQRNAQRRSWSEAKCGILKTPLFARCHAEVPVDVYLKRCVFDTCACDQGGDCECLCTAVAAYADACAQKGISIRWRSPHFCPMQCDPQCSDYSACTSACPVETCDNLLDQGEAARICHHENCVEGCLIKPCPTGQIYSNDTYTACVSKTECRPVCLVKDDRKYYEGDVTYSDDCATCRCSKKKEICSGIPCPPTVTTTESPNGKVTGSTEEPNQQRGKNCIHGWSRWFDRGSNVGGINLNDLEPLPKYDKFESIYGTCDREYMSHIECRVKDSKVPFDLVDDNVVCNLDKGLVCVGKCHDYEIRVNCQCDEQGRTTPKPPTTPPPTEPCNPDKGLFKEYPGDCHQYLRCMRKIGVSQWFWVSGTCGPNLMFNPSIGTCDQIATVSRIRSECRKTTDPCTDDQQWSDCANQCEHTCHFFGQQLIRRGLCKPNEHCKPGCVPKKRPDCKALGKFWRDDATCVDKDDCPCLDDHRDVYVKPHDTIITAQFDCQCVYNRFICVPKETTTETPPIGGNATTTPVPILPTTLTPPILCPPSSLIRLFTKGPTIGDDAFTASSHLNDKYKPQLARLHRKPKLNDGAWSPQVSDKSQYLQLKFENPLAFYGLLIAGDPHFDNYVTLFKVVYSLDGQSFHDVIDNTGQVQLFRGPKDSRAAIAQVFERPIEAISLRLYALKWQNTIALRVDFLLCNHLPSTTSKPPILTTPLPPTKPPTFKLICEDPLGVNNGALRQHQVSASSIWLSSLVDSQTSLLDLLKFNNQLGWRPLANKVDEFVDFDFLQPRNITAIQTRGGKSGWVTSYRVLFSLNKQIWNELPGPNDKSQIFKGNQDSQNDWRNDFERPIVTRYLRLIPTTWEHNINWRIEPIGCFLPYPNTTDPPPVKCAICDGFELPQGSQECPCQDGLFWMGTKCVERNHCPCIDNFTPYQIGSKFENKKCEECVCLLGGIISCKAKKCPPCRENTRLVQNGCNCECQLCPPSTRLCPTSGDCIPSEWWCNGVQNCADDEDETCDSKVTTIKPPTTPKPPPECPQIVCPPGYDIKITGKSPKALSSMFLFGFKEDDEVPEQLEVLQEWLGTLKSSPNEEVASAAYKVIASLDANKLEEWREDELAKNQVKAETLTLEQLEINELPLIPGQPEIESNILLKSPFGIEELLEKTQVVESTYPDNLSQEDPLVEEQLETDMKFVWNSGRLTGSGISLYGNDFKLPPELQALLDLQIKAGEDIDMQYCTAFCCLPQRRNVTKCEEPKCPPGYEPKVDETIIPAGSRQCPTFSCRRKRVPDDTCDINGRLFRTFDGTIYKYDICSHILARDIRGQRWSVRAQLQCAQNQNNCGSKTVIIEDKLAGNTLTILPNQRVIFNGYEFDARNLAQSSALRRSFFITHIGETIVVVCRQHKFWVQYGVNGNILLGVSQDLLGDVDGLCGFYNGQLFDDKRTPAGLLLIGTKDFGDSWFDRKLSLDQCRPQVCPVDLQQRALQLCNTVRHPLFDACSKSVNIQDYLDKCVESACQCLQINNGAEGNCRCDLLQQYVRQCLAVNPHLQLTTWRSVHRCPQPCRPPLIHYDCYKRRCEPHCGPQTRSTSVCPTVPNTCFPGCYCPEGTVRNGDDCVPVDDCKDCKCTMFGGNKFVTYDRTSYSFKGNCTYLVSRDLLLPGSYSFQVYVTIKPCGLANLENCVQALHVTAGEHTLHIEGTTNRSVHVIADGYFITLWPHQAPWLRVLQEREGELVVQLIQAKLELTLKLDTMQFLLTVPSVRYGNRMEGLCGNCNGLSIDDLQINQQKKPDKKPKFDLLDFVTSWQISEPRLGIDTQKCNDRNSKICKPLPREKNLCYQLIVNSGIFGRCPLLVNPLAYIQVCQQDTCSDGSDKRDICDALTAYAAECNAVGICVDWRPLAQCPAQCPAGLTYKPCDCYVNCETGIVREDKINQKLLRQERCLHTSRYEGCFCPNDQVLHHGKCVPPGQCISCGDGRHVGDLWQPDKCTKCTCLPSGQVSCEKEQCVQAKDVICQKGYKVQVQNLEFKCCPVYSCIPDIVKPGQQCEEPKLPNCGPNQNRRVDKDINGCPVYICECKPLDQCEPLKVIQLKPGEELHPLITGCCPDQKVVCVPSKCPKHPAVCPQPHYEIVSSLLPGDCCASYQCVPPKDKCLITDNGQVQAYKPGDQWQLPGKPCVSYECVNIDNTIQVVSTVLTCIKECRPGFSYVHNENTDKCCGSCVQTSCVHDGKISKPNEQWQSLDKCIIYTCVPYGGLLIIHEKQEICLDVNNCPPDQLVDDGGCCKRCKNPPPPPPKKVNCQTVSVPYERTINLIGYKSPDHGHCSNKEPIRGVTQCEGACSSSSKYNPINEKYLDSCSCCRANSLIKVSVKVQCEDGTSQEHFLDVPKDCSCEPCRHDELLEVKPRPVPTVHDNEESDEELDLQTLLQQS